MKHGFTLVELLVVLLVVSLLVSMSAVNLLSTMKRAAVNNAATDIILASNEARRLSLQQGTKGDVFYGIELVDDGTEKPHVMVIQRVHATGDVSPVVTSAGDILFKREIASSLIVMTGDTDLQSGDGRLVWFFGPGSGEVRALENGALTIAPRAVGVRPTTITNLWGIASNTGTPPVIAPATVDHPGLWIRDSNDDFRMSITVHHNGIPSLTESGGDS